MNRHQRTLCQHALTQIWETIYDHDASKYPSVESKLQRKAAFANIEMLQSIIAAVPFTPSPLPESSL